MQGTWCKGYGRTPAHPRPSSFPKYSGGEAQRAEGAARRGGSAPFCSPFCSPPRQSVATASNGKSVVDLISSIDNNAVTLCTFTSEISA